MRSHGIRGGVVTSQRLRAVIVSIALVLLATLLLAWPAAAPEYAQVRAAFVPSDAFLLDRNGELLDSVRIDRQVRRFEWLELSAISPALVSAVVRGEDA